jgi:phenylalanyl-tRNA synthetase beta chain
MLLTGQPVHAFDADKITGTVTVRKAKKNEKLILLGGETKKLSEEDIVIADEQRVLALAGIKGGTHAGISESTKNVFLEIATFDAPTIRRSKIRHNLATDASYRFERSLDPNLPKEVSREAVTLITTLAGGTLTGMRDSYPSPAKPWKISLPLERVENVLGTKVPLFEVVQYLALLGLQVKKVENQKTLTITVPTRRPDLLDEWDLIEEIGRMRGYDKVIPLAPLLPFLPVTRNPEKDFERKTKEYLAAVGFDEVLTYSFYGEKEIQATSLPLDHHLEIENPLSPDQKYLRMTQTPLLLRKVKENLRAFQALDLFEWGSAFAKDPKTGTPREVKSLELLSILPPEKELGGEIAAGVSKGKAFLSMKEKVAAFFEALHLDQAKISLALPEKFSHLPVLAILHPTRSAVFVYEGQPFGIIGEFHPKTLQAFGLSSVRLAPRIVMAGFVALDLIKTCAQGNVL